MEPATLQESLILHCKFTIKSLSQLLTTLQSTDGIQELQRDEETMAALSEIVSLTSSMSGIATRSLDDGADPVEDGMDSDRTRDRAPFIILPTEGPPFPRTRISRPPGPSMGSSREGKPLHSILLHYPLMSMIGLPLSVSERDRIQQEIELVTSTPLGSRSYPRVRLLDKQVVLILHDDADELEGLRSRFVLAQQSLWEQSSRIDLNFRFVRGWGDPLVLLIFRQHDYIINVPNVTKEAIEDIVAGRKDIVGALMARFPVLRQHQQLSIHDGPSTGAKIHKGSRISQGNAGSSQFYYTPRVGVIVPIISGDFDFAQDFARFYSPFTYEGVGFEINVERLQDPSDWVVEDGLGWNSMPETVTSYT